MPIEKFNNTDLQLDLIYQNGGHTIKDATFLEFLAGRTANARIRRAVFTCIETDGGYTTWGRLAIYDGDDSSYSTIVPYTFNAVGASYAVLENLVLAPSDTIRLNLGYLALSYIVDKNQISKEELKKIKENVRSFHIFEPQEIKKDDD